MFSQEQQEYFNELVLLGVQNRQLPANLYKYRADNKFTEAIFTNSALYFPNPPELNDPFDCQIQPAQPTLADVEQWVLTVTANPDDGLRLVEVARKDLGKFKDLINTKMRGLIDAAGLCSFSSKYDDLLMWAHYTGSHQGLCLKFDVAQDPALFTIPLKVSYGTTYPIYNHMTGSQEIVNNVLKAKSDHWAYEAEWRAYKPGITNKQVQFNPLALTEIMFGCKMSQVNIDKYKQLAISSGFQHVRFTKAVVSPQQFALSFVSC